MGVSQASTDGRITEYAPAGSPKQDAEGCREPPEGILTDAPPPDHGEEKIWRNLRFDLETTLGDGYRFEGPPPLLVATRSTEPAPRGGLCGAAFPADCRLSNNPRPSLRASGTLPSEAIGSTLRVELVGRPPRLDCFTNGNCVAAGSQ
ncbi:MAG: hypothetical protein LBT00_05250 [Spirochaetaceae bacterium]|nr:hypothetical protein [Spirochaetaceae bacterium]